jgi:tetratricopeptide (TPR) repeat protein
MENAQPVVPSPQEEEAIAEAIRTGVALHQRGFLDEAERLYAGVLKLEPRHFDALHLLGVLMQQRGQGAEALRLIGAALEVNGRHTMALDNHSKALLMAGRFAEALDSIDKVLAIEPGHVRALVNRATVFIEFGRHAEAAAAAEAALRSDPHYPAAWVKRGHALSMLKEHRKAIGCYNEALGLDPARIDALNNRGFSHAELGELEEALASFDLLLQLHPDNVDALINRGHVLVELQREQEALASYEQAFALVPDPDAAFNRGLNRLRIGDLRGWEGYDQRWSARAFPHRREERYPIWDGGAVNGTLLACAEQGLGEHILFAGMVPDLAARAAAVAVEVEPRLVPLFTRSFPGVTVAAIDHPWPAGAIAAEIPMGSLGRHFRASWEAFPVRDQGYLRADPALATHLRQRLDDGRSLIGLSWHSRNPNFEAAKSATLRDFAPLLQRQDCRFVDLQYGDTAQARAEAERELGVRIEHLDDVDNTNDLDALAALTCACDRVVTVSNTTAHLAGALGRETHVLVPPGRGRMWFWFKDRDDSPWYPRVRLYRQRRGQPWTEVVAGLASGPAGRAR